MLKEISIEIIRKCPNYCLHCSSNSDINCIEMITFDKFVEIVDGAVKLGLKTICLSGGEPFLHPEIVKLIEYVHIKEVSVYVYTSGIFLDDEGIKTSIPMSVIEEISDKVTKLIFNIEAANSKRYNMIMGTAGGFELMKQSVMNAYKCGIVTEAHFVPMKVNIDQIEPVNALCEELKISKLSFLRLVLHGRAHDNADKIYLSDEETRNLQNQLNALKQKSLIDIRLGVPLSEGNNKHNCEAAKGKINIKYDGYVYPCEVFKNNKVNMNGGIQPESIFEKNIDSIYNQSQYLNQVREFIKQFAGNKTCENCIGQYFIKTFSKDGEKFGE